MFRFVIVLLVVLLIGLGAYAVLWPAGQRQAKRQGSPKHSVASPAKDRNQSRFDRAIKSLAEQKDDEALSEIRRLAKIEPAFLPAHRFMVAHLTALNQTTPSIQVTQRLIKHLEVLSDEDDVDAQQALGRIYLVLGRTQDGIDVLRRAVRGQPEGSVLLAKALQKSGQNSEAQQVSATAIDRYQRHLAKNPSDTNARVALSQHLSFHDRHQEAVQVLRKDVSQSRQIRNLLQQAVIRQVDAITPNDAATAMDLLEQAITDDPTFLAAWTRIVGIKGSGASPVADQASRLVEASLADQDTAGNLELVLGAEAFANSDLEKAVQWLELAYESNANDAVIVGTLVAYLSRMDPPQLKRALELSEKLIRENPGRRELLAIRGKVFAAMERYRDAIADLEQVLQNDSGNLEIVKDLAYLYDKIGEEAKATALRESVREKRATRPDEGNRLLDPAIFPSPTR